MPRCLNCNYLLVLLERRRKYKCAKCGKLFLQTDIDNREFVEWNKKRRQEYGEKIEQEFKKEKKPKLTEEEKLESNRNSQRKWRENNREHYNEQKREYWASNRKHLLEKRKENYQKRKPEILRQQVLYRQNNNVLSKIKHLREQQKVLALRILEFNLERALNAQI